MSVVVGRTNTGSVGAAGGTAICYHLIDVYIWILTPPSFCLVQWTEGPSGPGSVVLGPVWAQDTVDGHAGLRIAEALGLSFLDFAALT